MKPERIVVAVSVVLSCAAVAGVLLIAATHAQPALPQGMPSKAEMAEMEAKAEAYRKQEAKTSIEINDLVQHITTPEDAGQAVELVANDFGNDMSKGSERQQIVKLVAEAEYRSTTQPNGLIPDQQIANAWNAYLDEIGAPSSQHVSASVIYYLRDAEWVAARAIWQLDKQIWAIPGIYAKGPDGRLRDGATALEAVRVVYDLADTPHNVELARTLQKKGVLCSEELRQKAKHPHPRRPGSFVGFSSGPDTNPVHVATRNYIHEHGAQQYQRVVIQLINRLFAAPATGESAHVA